MGEEGKKFLALLNGISRRIYHGEDQLSDDFLANQIFPDDPKEQSNALITKASVLLKVYIHVC